MSTGWRRAAGILLVAGGIGALVGMACSSPTVALDPLEQRAQALDKSLMCPICPGESLDQSQTQLSKQMRQVVREKLAEGWTDDQVKEFFVQRYGPAVLMAPPQEGFNLLAWAIPSAAVAGALGALALVLRQLRRAAANQGQELLEALPEEERRGYLQQAESMLQGDPRLGPTTTPPREGGREEQVDGRERTGG